MPLWGPQPVPQKLVPLVVPNWGHNTPILVEHERAFEVAAWGGASRLAPQAVSKWGEPRATQAVFEVRTSLEQGGKLPSVGSVGHDDGSCKRCAFFPKGRCKNGEDCTHCHFEHPKPLRSRRRKRCAKGMEIEDFSWSAEEYNDDDVSTQAGTTLASHSVAADEQRNEALDEDSEVSDSESMPDHGAIGSDSAEEELVTRKTTPCSETAELACDAKVKSMVVSADSWAARQRLRQMERGCSAPSVVAIESADVEECESKSMSPQNSPAKSMSPPQSESKVFESSAGSWAVQQRRLRSEREENSPEDIARKAKGILNKLTQERFEPLCQQILDLPVRTSEQLAALVAEIFDKATTEKGFLTLYTELCARLDAHLAAEGSCVGGKVFRKALVTECQASFERNLQQPLDPETLVNLTYEERYVEEVKHKTRTLGNMRFIGELLIRKLLAGKILFFIVNEMLDTNSEASLESLVELLSVVSPALERKGTIYEAPLRETFGTLRQKSKDRNFSMRIRCKLNDLLDLRSVGWTGKVVDKTGDKSPKVKR